MNDYLFYIALIFFFFIIWLYAGGPNNPISFSGPYITPVTDVGSTQVGYDDGNSVWNAYRGDVTSIGKTDVLDSAVSPYSGSVSIVGSRPEEGSADREYLTIRSSMDDDVTITGWQLVSAKSGAQIRIPEGYDGSRKRAVRLSEGEEAVIFTSTRGASELRESFRDSWNVFLDRRSDVWNDRSDTITLLDGSGKVVDQYRY
jgi:hypothetical protein